MGRLANLDDEFMPYLTNHASARMGSRHISPTEVAFVMNYGRSYHVRGAVIYVMGRHEVESCRNDRVISDNIKGLQVVCAQDNDAVITVYRNNDLRRLRRRRTRQDH